MTRLRGWAPKGERLVDKVPQGKWKTATFLAALRNDRVDAPCLFDGPINGERFRAYVDQFLAPTLKPGDVVILDNLSTRTRQRPCDGRSATPGWVWCFCRILPRPQSDRAGLRQVQKPGCERREREATKPSPKPALKSSPNTRPPNATAYLKNAGYA
jgi:DDE superfamily endonuclease